VHTVCVFVCVCACTCVCLSVVCAASDDHRAAKIKVEIKPMSPGGVSSADNISDIHRLVKGLHIAGGTPTVCRHLALILSLSSVNYSPETRGIQLIESLTLNQSIRLG